MKHYVYILESDKTGKYYTGSTSDIDKRLIRHNAGATQSTRFGRPWEIVYKEEYPNKTEALLREKEIKKMKSRIYIESLITKSKELG